MSDQLTPPAGPRARGPLAYWLPAIVAAVVGIVLGLGIGAIHGAAASGPRSGHAAAARTGGATAVARAAGARAASPTPTPTVPASPTPTPAWGPNAKAVYAFDIDTGKVLYENGAETPIHAASLIKLLGLLITVDEINAGQITWDQKIQITDPVIEKMSEGWSTGGYNLKVGQTFTVKELFSLALVASNNAAITQLGLTLGGSNSGFVDMMRQRAAKLGITDATLVSVSGLDNKTLAGFNLMYPGTDQSAGNLVSAKDLGLITRQLMTEYPAITEISSMPKVPIKSSYVYNTVQLLKGGAYYDPSLHVTGLKTGLTTSAGHCLVATTARPGKDRIGVVIIHAKSSWDRFAGAANLLRALDAIQDGKDPASAIIDYATASSGASDAGKD
ncbi:MAG: serine hydrolase [Bifidobacteriaceae bacterium]|nr:serine hydrolase [Bifidobacteriaceae bacterium]